MGHGGLPHAHRGFNVCRASLPEGAWYAAALPLAGLGEWNSFFTTPEKFETWLNAEVVIDGALAAVPSAADMGRQVQLLRPPL